MIKQKKQLNYYVSGCYIIFTDELNKEIKRVSIHDVMELFRYEIEQINPAV